MARLILIIRLILASALLAPMVAWAQQAAGGNDARIYILDASNSMNGSRDYSGNRTRFTVARDVLLRELRALAQRNDRQPTAVYVFGSQTSWPETKARSGSRYRSAADYPHDGRLCQDITRIAGFGSVDDTYVRRMTDILGRTRASGMTPVNVAIKLALQQLAAYGGGEIVLISDYENPNCLPPGQDMCGDILGFAREVAIDLNEVKVSIYKIPESTLRADLQDCLQVNEYPVETDAQPREDAVRERRNRLTVTPDTVYAERPLSATGPDAASLTYSLTSTDTGRVVGSGPLGPVEIERGGYRLAIRQGNRVWDAIFDVQRSKRLKVAVDPGVLIVDHSDAGSGAAAPSPVTLDLFRVGPGNTQQPLGRERLSGGRARLAMGDGVFRIVAQANGKTAEHLVALSLGETKTLSLRFDSPALERQVLIRVRSHPPTLLAARFTRPEVDLMRNGQTVLRLHDGDNALRLEPGRYRIAIHSRPPHALPFTVKPEGDHFTATVELTPGWFEAAAARAGRFVLFDGQGKPVAQFQGDSIAHSLPDGTYRLEFSDGEHKTLRADFEISLGRLTEVGLR